MTNERDEKLRAASARLAKAIEYDVLRGKSVLAAFEMHLFPYLKVYGESIGREVLARLDAPTSPPETPLYTRPVCAKPCRHGKPCVRPPHADDVICICDDEVGPVSREPG